MFVRVKTMLLDDWRKEGGLTLERAANACGIKTNTYIALNYGRRVGSVETCALIEAATNFRVTAQDLLDAQKTSKERSHARKSRQQGEGVGVGTGDAAQAVDDGAPSSGDQDTAPDEDPAEPGGGDLHGLLRERGPTRLPDSEPGLDPAGRSQVLQWDETGLVLLASSPSRDDGQGDGTK